MKKIILIDLKKIKRFNSPKLQISVPNYGKVFALKNGDLVRGAGSNIQIYDSTTGQIKRNLVSSNTYSYLFGQLSNGLLVAGYRDNKTFLIWDLNVLNGEPLKYVIKANEDLGCLTILKNDDLVIGQYSPIIQKIDIIIRDSKSGSIKHTLVGHTAGVTKIIELSNGNLISSAYDATVRIWNHTFSSSPLRTISHSALVTSFVILKNGNLASSLYDGRIEIRNFETGDLIRTLTGHTGIHHVDNMHVLDNGDLVSISLDKTLKVWNPYDGTMKLSNNAHKYPIYQLGSLPKGNLFSVSTNEIFIL